jgi:colanic acid biosynthesis glycosyl transferase WcaI
VKVLIVGLNYAPEPVGIGPYTAGLAESLAAAGHSVEAIVAEPYYPDWERAFGPKLLWHTRTEQRVRVVRCRVFIPHTPTGIARIVLALSFALCALPRAIWSALRRRPEVVFAVTPSLFTICAAWIAARLSGAKLWTHVQDFEVDAACATGLIRQGSLFGRGAKRFERAVLHMSDKVSTISPQMQARLVAQGVPAGRTYQLRNWAVNAFGPDLREAARYRAQWDIGTRKVVLYSGSISNKQGIEIIVDAARMLREREDIVFLICGNGPNRTRLEANAEGLPNVQIHPLQPALRMGGVLALAQLHVLPQIAEAADLVLPSKLCNMLLSGRPVIVTANPGTGLADEVAGCGLVTPPGDAAALAAAITTLVDDDQLADRLGRGGVARARTHWGQAEILSAFEAELLRLARPSDGIMEPHKPAELPSK